jgi:hypothetical protein
VIDRTGKSTHAASLWTIYNSMPTNYGASIIRGDKMDVSLLDPTGNTTNAFNCYRNYLNSAFSTIHYSNLCNVPGVRIYDRLHLSECVYGTKYRNYDGGYVYGIEDDYLNETVPTDNVVLITLIDKVENLIKRDDGDGFTSDPVEILKEIEAFKDAHDDSKIINKFIIDISEYDCDIDKVRNQIFKILNI